MMKTMTYKHDSGGKSLGYDITFIVRGTGEKLVRTFRDEHEAYLFANKLRHSRKCVLVSCPRFS